MHAKDFSGHGRQTSLWLQEPHARAHHSTHNRYRKWYLTDRHSDSWSQPFATSRGCHDVSHVRKPRNWNNTYSVTSCIQRIATYDFWLDPVLEISSVMLINLEASSYSAAISELIQHSQHHDCIRISLQHPTPTDQLWQCQQLQARLLS